MESCGSYFLCLYGPLSTALMVITWVGGLTLGKALLVLGVVRLLGYSLRVATMAALGLAQIGEFSFILVKAGLPEGLLSAGDYQRFLAASILSMILTPFLIKAAPRAGYALQSVFAPGSVLEPSVVGFNPEELDLSGHIIIVGYGLNGRNLAKVLRRTGVTVIAVVREGETEINPALDFRLRAEDVLILIGSPAQINSAAQQIHNAEVETA